MSLAGAATAKWAEAELGRAEIERSTESQQMGASSQREGVNVNRQVAQEAVVLASELQTLTPMQGYFRSVGTPVMKIAYGVDGLPRPVGEPAFVAGPEVSELEVPQRLEAMRALDGAREAVSRRDPERALPRVDMLPRSILACLRSCDKCRFRLRRRHGHVLEAIVNKPRPHDFGV